MEHLIDQCRVGTHEQQTEVAAVAVTVPNGLHFPIDFRVDNIELLKFVYDNVEIKLLGFDDNKLEEASEVDKFLVDTEIEHSPHFI